MDRKAQDVVVASLRENLGDVALDRTLGQEELLRDFLARLGLAHEAQDIDLHVSQRSRVREDALLGARRGKVE